MECFVLSVWPRTDDDAAANDAAVDVDDMDDHPVSVCARNMPPTVYVRPHVRRSGFHIAGAS